MQSLNCTFDYINANILKDMIILWGAFSAGQESFRAYLRFAFSLLKNNFDGFRMAQAERYCGPTTNCGGLCGVAKISRRQ